jgi:tRNA threonylcarbamoyl adenosine modification protein YeaZ
LVEDAGLTADAIGEIVVSRGPGSFTGIRAGLATAKGLQAAVGAKILAFDSLLMLAARCDSGGRVWGAQPGRRGEVYARHFEISEDGPPQPLTEIEIVTIEDASDIGPWVAAEALDLGGLDRAEPSRSSAEALLRLAELEVAPDAAEPLYVEGPPVHHSPKKR